MGLHVRAIRDAELPAALLRAGDVREEPGLLDKQRGRGHAGIIDAEADEGLGLGGRKGAERAGIESEGDVIHGGVLQ